MAWVQETDIDGFNLSRIVTPESLADFIDLLVVPVLQERGVYKLEYSPGTLRQKLFRRARLPPTHPAAAHRRFPPPEQQRVAK
jgi:long-chain alkane monooxygenase